MYPESVRLRFLAKVKQTGECWLWTASKRKTGYGSFGVNRRTRKAHRVSYEIFVGAIPKGKQVHHRCDNPSCVFPGHLWVGTQLENLNDMRLKGRGSSPPGSMKLSLEQVQEIRRIGKSMTLAEIGQLFGVSLQMVFLILRGKVWKAGEKHAR